MSRKAKSVVVLASLALFPNTVWANPNPPSVDIHKVSAKNEIQAPAKIDATKVPTSVAAGQTVDQDKINHVFANVLSDMSDRLDQIEGQIGAAMAGDDEAVAADTQAPAPVPGRAPAAKEEKADDAEVGGYELSAAQLQSHFGEFSVSLNGDQAVMHGAMLKSCEKQFSVTSVDAECKYSVKFLKGPESCTHKPTEADCRDKGCATLTDLFGAATMNLPAKCPDRKIVLARKTMSGKTITENLKDEKGKDLAYTSSSEIADKKAKEVAKLDEWKKQKLCELYKKVCANCGKSEEEIEFLRGEGMDGLRDNCSGLSESELEKLTSGMTAKIDEKEKALHLALVTNGKKKDGTPLTADEIALERSWLMEKAESDPKVAGDIAASYVKAAQASIATETLDEDTGTLVSMEKNLKLLDDVRAIDGLSAEQKADIDKKKRELAQSYLARAAMFGCSSDPQVTGDRTGKTCTSAALEAARNKVGAMLTADYTANKCTTKVSKECVSIFQNLQSLAKRETMADKSAKSMESYIAQQKMCQMGIVPSAEACQALVNQTTLGSALPGYTAAGSDLSNWLSLQGQIQLASSNAASTSANPAASNNSIAGGYPISLNGNVYTISGNGTSNNTADRSTASLPVNTSYTAPAANAAGASTVVKRQIGAR